MDRIDFRSDTVTWPTPAAREAEAGAIVGNDFLYSSREVAQRMRERANVWVGTTGSRKFRTVTHYGVGQEEVKTFLDLLEDILRN